MKEFLKARLKLTGWYLIIIMLISSLFSGAVYKSSTYELERGLRRQALRFLPREKQEERSFNESLKPINGLLFSFRTPFPSGIDRSIFEEAKRRIIVTLLLVNGGIFVISGFTAYFLAGKTLRPIEAMIEEQKRFVADSSHEIRTPLTSLKTEIEVALRDKKLDLATAKKLLRSNLDEVNKMQSLSNYLLTLSKYEDEKLKLSFENVKLKEVIKKVTKKFSVQAQKKQIKITLEGQDINLEANPTSIFELISIFLDNAIKYSHKGGLIIIKTKTTGRDAFASVQDFGIGIKNSDIPYVFDRFYRADTSRSKTQVDGYGLGLSIAKSIVEAHNGKIWVESALGQGSTFTVSLPLKRRTKLI